MKRRHLRALACYVRVIADQLELRDWTITLVEQPLPADHDAHAVFQALYGRKRAQIRFEAAFRDLDPATQRHVVVHELLHAHFDQIDTPVENGLEHLLGKPAYCLFFEHFRVALENAVDAVASALAPHMPLIDWSYCNDSLKRDDRGGDIRMEPWRP